MTEKEIFDRIVTIIQERQGEDFVVTEALSLKDDLDADSVDLMEFILTLEDEFNIEISDEEIDQLQSVGDVVEVVKSKEQQEATCKSCCFFIMRLLVRLAPLGARQKNHPLCGCASKVIPQKLQTRYNKGVQANCKVKGEKYGTKSTQFITHKVDV